ncbi:hypothetical protein EDI_340720 [Entamoeba dispar SAW760]|uniref:RING-type domain-containing protein n=1 Tax=Entamoeba dispar (strain ATCC PRA-260 / SAW760) TaxID=370354 RepID=B0EJD6_ENTDS|nr:uncharacterized protein EDI_340720 [Entamoeba dispar SAW760]EDR25373.1 hypothetical protein EDI_340720 [Entamoeba dispar SAW760]|eukprot:EDR25373.1 hypothetical protein EDI_340720 [Entamoeba dispar SAW760]
MTCPLCLTPLTNPITLPCGQIICSDCVDSLLLGGSEMECPLCMNTHNTNDIFTTDKQVIDNTTDNPPLISLTLHDLPQDNQQPSVIKQLQQEQSYDTQTLPQVSPIIEPLKQNTESKQSIPILEIQNSPTHETILPENEPPLIPVPVQIPVQPIDYSEEVPPPIYQPPYIPTPQQPSFIVSQPTIPVYPTFDNSQVVQPTPTYEIKPIPQKKLPPLPPPKPNTNSTNPFDEVSSNSSSITSSNTYYFSEDEIPPQFTAAYGAPIKQKPQLPNKASKLNATHFDTPTKKVQVQTKQSSPNIQNPSEFQPKSFNTPIKRRSEYVPVTYEVPSTSVSHYTYNQEKAVASGNVVCSSANFNNDNLPLHFMRQEQDSEDLYKIFNKWISSGLFSSKKLLEVVESQPIIFDDIHMIPFLWIQLTFGCDGCIGYYERPLSNVICLWQSSSPYRSLLLNEVIIPPGRIYKFDPKNPNARTLKQIENPSVVDKLSGWFKGNDSFITKDIPKRLFEDSKEPIGIYQNYVQGQIASLTREYKQTALKSTQNDFSYSCNVKIIQERSKVQRIYIPFCFTSYRYEGELNYVLINTVSGEVYGNKKKSVFGIQWNSK